MPESLNGTEDVSSTSSEATTLDVEKQGNPAEQEKALDSSTEADGKETVSEKDWDPLSVVKKAISDDRENSESSDKDQDKQPDGSSKSENDGQKSESESEDLGEITDDELKSYKPKTRKRIEGLLDDRQRLTERLQELEPAADQMNSLQNFMQERNLTAQNVSELMVVGGLAMSEDPKDLRAALKRVNEFKQQIESQLGDTLPDDLQKKVQEGDLDAESAKELALSRVEKQRLQRKVEQAETTAEAVNTQAGSQTHAAMAEVVHATISDWQRQKVSSDPDYPRKAELLQKEIRLRVSEAGGKVLDKNKAIEIAEQAYAEVNRLYKALSPAKAPEAKRMMQSKAVPGNMASRPSSPLEAARAALAKT